LYPNLWTIPGIDFHIRTYGFIVGISFVIALLIARRRARLTNLDAGVMTNLALIGMIGGLVGGPLMHFLHYGNFGGREVIGGVVFGIACALGYLRVTGRSIFGYLDAAIPAMILAMGIGRLGCLMFGCCWGGACQLENGDRSLAWAIHFPYCSPLYVADWMAGRQQVPDELLWINPASVQQDSPLKKEPIPPFVLGLEIDNDEALKNWASAAYAFSKLRGGDPKSEALAAASKAFADAKKALTNQDPFAKAAAAHLVKLNAKPETRDTTWRDLRALSNKQFTAWVHPAQLYDFIALTLLFAVLSAIFWRRYRRGTVLAWAMILYPINRVIMETIRTDNPREFGGLTISQVVCLAIFVFGVVFAVWLGVGPKAPVLDSRVRGSDEPV
jgi:phosphatidylglycerol:prolipoprotein diacylglycerol transferase